MPTGEMVVKRDGTVSVDDVFGEVVGAIRSFGGSHLPRQGQVYSQQRVGGKVGCDIQLAKCYGISATSVGWCEGADYLGGPVAIVDFLRDCQRPV